MDTGMPMNPAMFFASCGSDYDTLVCCKLRLVAINAALPAPPHCGEAGMPLSYAVCFTLCGSDYDSFVSL